MSVFLISMLTLQSTHLFDTLCYTLKLKTYQNIQPNSFCEVWVTLLPVFIILYYYYYYLIPLSFLLESVTGSDVVQHHYHVQCWSVNL